MSTPPHGAASTLTAVNKDMLSFREELFSEARKLGYPSSACRWVRVSKAFTS